MIRFLPLLEKIFRKHKCPVGGSWRMDDIYIKVKGVWKYLYRAVDQQRQTVFYFDGKARQDSSQAVFRKGDAS
jgi:transposase-like protein